jgi:2-(1,2-epoxy-1,2-dihydrophenyl)acetyl-CoA isomerase
VSDVDSRIETELEGSVGQLIFGSSGAMHVVDESFGGRLVEAMQRLAAEERVRAVLLHSRARVFCAGVAFDLVPRLADEQTAARFIASLNEGIAALAELPKPTVAAVGGAAYGGGHNMALACDVLVAGERAVFSQSFGNVGLATDMGSLYLLPRRVGAHRAKELAITARPLSAGEALDIGAVDMVVADSKLLDRASEVAGSLSERSPLAIAAMKRGFREAEGMTFRESLALEARLQMPQFASSDLQEAAAAFLEKRPIAFRGR